MCVEVLTGPAEELDLQGMTREEAGLMKQRGVGHVISLGSLTEKKGGVQFSRSVVSDSL